MKFKIKMELSVTKEDIEDIIEMAGYGISYWADEAIVKKDSYVVHEEDGDWYKLDYNDILKGIEMYIRNGNKSYNILDGDKLDSGEIDSEVADMIIQYACFGTIEYC